jgi:hypothetical protein
VNHRATVLLFVILGGIWMLVLLACVRLVAILKLLEEIRDKLP